MHGTHNLLEIGEIVKQELKLDVDEVWVDLREPDHTLHSIEISELR